MSDEQDKRWVKVNRGYGDHTSHGVMFQRATYRGSKDEHVMVRVNYGGAREFSVPMHADDCFEVGQWLIAEAWRIKNGGEK